MERSLWGNAGERGENKYFAAFSIKHRVKNVKDFFSLFETKNDWLFWLGDIKISKAHKKSESYCLQNENSFYYHGIENSLCGKTSSSNSFTPKRILVIQMEMTEEQMQIAKEKKAQMIVVGDPINMNGTRGPRSEKCNLFAEKLRELVDVEVRMWDERSSTVTAITYMNETNKRGKKRREVLDQAKHIYG